MKHLRRTSLQVVILSSLAFLLISLHASLGSAQRQQETAAAQTPPTRRGSDAVMLTVTVRDQRRNYVKGLTHINFTVSDGKQEQQIKAFADGDMPLSVGILLDTSSSIKKESLKPIREALSRFFKLSNETNEYFLVGFNTQPKLLQDWTTDVTSVLKQIDAAAASEGATALFDACYFGVEKVARGRHRKRAMILISDGLDSISKRSFIEVRRLLEESDVLLYCINVRGVSGVGGNLRLEGQAILDELSTTTGGVLFFPDDAKEINVVFDMIAIELRNQYLIVFIPTATDGKRHSLKISVMPPANAPREMQKLNVRSRKSFYAKTNQR